MIARTQNIRISPKKLNLIAHMVRGMSVAKAIELLEFTPKKGARILSKILNSAKANAENNFKQDASKLMISEIMVGDGVTLKRRRPVSRGRSHPILKRTSNIIVKVNIID